VLLPYDRGDLVNRLHNEAEILTSEHTEHGTRLEANVNQTLVDELAAYSV
jgi:GTP-binding protein HflX